jgi:hypothetical protein
VIEEPKKVKKVKKKKVVDTPQAKAAAEKRRIGRRASTIATDIRTRRGSVAM